MSTLAVAGDVLLGDQPALLGWGIASRCAPSYAGVLAGIAGPLARFDAVAANLETAICGGGPRAWRHAPMRAPAQALAALRDANVRYVSVANNHSADYGTTGFDETCRLAAEAGLVCFGSHAAPWVATAGGIALLGFCMVPTASRERPPYLAVDPADPGSVAELCRVAAEARRACRGLVVLAHWGFEFVEAPDASQVEIARRLAGAGASAILGCHPHVVQHGWEIAGVPVVFSLGNLVSDYWQPRLRHGLVAEVRVADRAEVALHAVAVDERFRVAWRGAVTPPARPVAAAPPPGAAEINRARARVRRELLGHWLRHPASLLRHPWVLGWAARRALFVLRRRRELARSPEAIYRG